MISNTNTTHISLNEYTLKTRINSNLLLINDKLAFIKSSLTSSSSSNLVLQNYNQITKLFTDLQSLFSSIEIDLVKYKEQTESNDKSQLLYFKYHKQYTSNISLMKTLKMTFHQVIQHEEEQNNNNNNTITDSDNEMNIEENNKLRNGDEIEEIYAKTKLISQISKDIHILAKKQENKLESIESNIIHVNENAIASSKAIDTKDKASQQALSSSTNKLISYLLILIIIFILIIYYNST
jgi:hypothetical protein